MSDRNPFNLTSKAFRIPLVSRDALDKEMRETCEKYGFATWGDWLGFIWLHCHAWDLENPGKDFKDADVIAEYKADPVAFRKKMNELKGRFLARFEIRNLQERE